MTALSADEERERSVAAFRRRVQRLKGHAADEPKEKLVREVTIPETITIQELANRMAERGVDVIKLLMKQGQMAQDQRRDRRRHRPAAWPRNWATPSSASPSPTSRKDCSTSPTIRTTLLPRPPVVTIMGHVDHGKTSLLDAIRSTDVAAGEAGGITQHIGAYQVTAPSASKITFIDTPGHAAFTAMRARGAKVTDIVVLVVAADDGVMPQTVEAINHAKAAKVPMIVAINKIDKPDAKPERVRTSCCSTRSRSRSLGGEVLDVEVSATKKTNLDRLLEDHRAAGRNSRPQGQSEPSGRRHGDRGQARPRPRPGRHRAGAARHAAASATSSSPAPNGAACARWSTTRGAPVERAGPSTPVEVLGFTGTPEAGDRFAVVETEARAREVTDYRARQTRDEGRARATGMRGSLEQMMSQLKASGRKDLPLIIKADVQGSLEAIVGALEKLGTDEVGARVIHSGVGGITESDVTLAEASGAPIIGFNVRAHKEAREAAERGGIEIRYYNIIYDLVDDVKTAMSGLLAPSVARDHARQRRRSWRSSRSPRSATSPAAASPTAWSSAAPMCASSATTSSCTRASSRSSSASRTTRARWSPARNAAWPSRTIRTCKVGDVIECYRVETVQRSL